MSLLEAQNISKAFGGIRALDACSVVLIADPQVILLDEPAGGHQSDDG